MFHFYSLSPSISLFITSLFPLNVVITVLFIVLGFFHGGGGGGVNIGGFSVLGLFGFFCLFFFLIPNFSPAVSRVNDFTSKILY